MSPSLVLRRVRHLCTTAATTASKPVTISQTKSRIRNEHNPDEVLKIYSSFTSANDPTAVSPSSTRYVQELTVKRLAKSHRFSDIKNFLESHKSQPHASNETYLSSIIRSYGVVGMFENALNTYNEMADFGTPRTALSFNALLSACVHSKLFDRVPGYFDELPGRFGFEPDKFSYGILIKSYCEMGKPEVAIEKLGEMEGKGVEVGAVSFTTILHALYKAGKVDEAERFWEDMVVKKELKPDVGSYNARIWSVQGGDPDGVRALIEEMRGSGLEPDAISYNYLISSYAEKGMMDEAKKVYEDMCRTKGIRPNGGTYRILVFNLCKKGRFVTAFRVFKQSVQASKIPDFNTLKYLVEGLAKEGRMLEAKAMVRTMNKKFPPDLLKAWGKVAEDLGLAAVGEEGDDDGELEKEVDTDEAEKVSA